MFWLILGIIIWCDVHFFKRILPAGRMAMDEKLGAGPAKGVIALLLVISVVFMIIGYRSMDHLPVYTPISGIGHLNNLLMLIAVALMGLGASKGRARSWLRHPMLTGVIVWGMAHLLVNGDLASIFLFGGMILWAIGEMVLINRSEGAWLRPEPGPASGDIRLAIITIVLFAIIAGIHTALGYNPFLGTYG
ncbi:membrane protein [Amylibacter ulvae]|uniref:Membrane protein n=1 Tax=Paramylibacter ulvae TaxID=1651968 RepID=A0ABQ3D987_9RHOB|nr:NnrU family protein [Amylibacter ulvae]GHA61129.1 membrane protein [Amylibacter ulvae]